MALVRSRAAMNFTVYSQNNNNNNNNNNNDIAVNNSTMIMANKEETSSSLSSLSSSWKVFANASSKRNNGNVPFQDVTNRNLSSYQKPYHHHHQQHKKNKIYNLSNKQQAQVHQPSPSSLSSSSSRFFGATATASTTTILPKRNNNNNNNTLVLNPFGSIPSLQQRQQQEQQHQQQHVENPFDAVDIDKRDRQISNPLSVTEYVDSIYEYLRKQERKSGPLPNGVTGQLHIDTNCLSILIDWLMAINERMENSSETLYLTVSILHRYLSAINDLPRNELQLLGITAFLLASKYEEVWVPSLDELCYICANAYHKEDILEMETDILETIGYDLSSRPSPYKFLQRFCKAAASASSSANTYKATTRRIANYVLDGTLVDHRLQATYLPSELAAASLLIALKATTTNPYEQRQTCSSSSSSSSSFWNFVLEHHTQYSEFRLINVAKDILLKKKSTPEHLQQVDKNHSHKLAKSHHQQNIHDALDSVLSWLMQQQQQQECMSRYC